MVRINFATYDAMRNVLRFRVESAPPELLMVLMKALCGSEEVTCEEPLPQPNKETA